MTKKVKRTISLIIAAIMLLSTMTVLAFAGTKLPTYAEATGKEVGPHDCVAAVKNGVIVKTEDKAAYAQPTCTKAGSAEYVINCAICGKELSREKVTLPKLKSHVPSDEVSIENVKAPTCGKDGYYFEVVRCKFCNAVLESTKVIVNKTTAHVAGLPVKENIKAATCAKVGSYDSVIYCKVCGLQLQRTFKEVPKLTYHVSIDSLDRTVSNDAGVFTVKGNSYVNGKTRTCADGEDYCAVCGELLRPAIPHVWDKGTVSKAPGMQNPGVKTYRCLIDNCGATKTTSIPATGIVTKGDADGDGVVTTADARFVLRYAVGLGNFDKVISDCCTDDSFKAADYDKNGKIESADARMTLRSAVGLRN